MDVMKIYEMLPVCVQNLACYYEGNKIKRTRYNVEFLSLLKEYEERKSWSYEQLSEYRDEKLRKMIQYAYDNTIYYKRIMNEGGVNPSSIHCLDDLKKLPIVTKKEINENFEEFVVSTFPKNKIVHSHTSGTTGSGFKFYNTTDTIHNQWAAFWRGRRELGIDLDTWCAQFASRPAVPIKQTKPPFYRMNYPCHQVYMSAFHENNDNLYDYYNVINKKKITWIHGYPSLITPLAMFMKENRLSFDYPIQYVTTGAENLLEHQVKLIREVFGVEPRQVYGQSENVAIFNQKEDGKIYVDEDFSAVEFIEREDGNVEIIGTSLYNFAMPLIRYSMKDYVTLPPSQSGDGSRIVEKIDGRNEDYIFLKDGTKIGKLDHVFKDTINFAQVQIYQKKNYDVEVYIVRSSLDCKQDEEISRKQFERSIGNNLKIEYKYVDEIGKTKSGKTKFVVSEIKEEEI